MASLEEIQNMVKQAQEEISNRNYDQVRRATWPAIRSAITQLNDLARLVRSNMGFNIHLRLDEQSLHGGTFTPINVEQLKADFQADLGAGSLQEPELPPYKWLPY